jgi:Beta-lactamase enzyme family
MFFTVTPKWQALGEGILAECAAANRVVDLSRMAVVLAQVGPFGVEGFAHRAAEPVYPCSLVKSFHLIHALAALEEGRIEHHGELDRAMRDMILWSSNTATNYVIDILTGTTGDILLDGAEYLDWKTKREKLNRFFWRMGWDEWDGCRIAQKVMDDTRYGREARFADEGGDNLNRLTAAAAARLIWDLFDAELPLSPPSGGRAQAILSRDLRGPDAGNPAYQLAGYLGGDLPPEVQIWSKAGHNLWTGDPRTSWFRHDMIRITAAGRRPLVAVVMTEGEDMARADTLLPGLGRMIWDRVASIG